MAKQKPTKMLAILGRSQRTGRWRLASRSSVLALLGACHLDMRASFVEDDMLKMKVTVLFGSATFVLPAGAEVRPSGMSLLAASTVDVLEHDESAELPLLEIEWTAVLGRIRILTHRDDGESGPKSGQTAKPVASKPAKPVDAAPPAVGFEDLDDEESAAPAVGFEDLDEESAAPAVGFEDLDEESAAPAVGFEDLDDEAPAVGFEDLDDDESAAPAVGFEDLDEESAAPVGVGFEDL